jgi:hypothetical protein
MLSHLEEFSSLKAQVKNMQYSCRILRSRAVTLPDKTVGSCLDPELPEPVCGGRGLDAGPGPTSLKEKVSWDPAEMGKS